MPKRSLKKCVSGINAKRAITAAAKLADIYDNMQFSHDVVLNDQVLALVKLIDDMNPDIASFTGLSALYHDLNGGEENDWQNIPEVSDFLSAYEDLQVMIEDFSEGLDAGVVDADDLMGNVGRLLGAVRALLIVLGANRPTSFVSFFALEDLTKKQNAQEAYAGLDVDSLTPFSVMEILDLNFNQARAFISIAPKLGGFPPNLTGKEGQAFGPILSALLEQSKYRTALRSLPSASSADDSFSPKLG